jgi:dipeptidyl aminopeptidase/acylaminoacyl peptidase
LPPCSAAGSVTAQGDIWIAERSGGGQRRLTRSAGIDESDPTFSPNGGLIAYVRRSQGNADIWVMRADGSRKRPLATGTLDELQPAFYPGGRSLLFTRFDGSRGWTVLSIRLDGTRTQTQVPNATFPVVSANGRWLAYSKAETEAGSACGTCAAAAPAGSPAAAPRSSTSPRAVGASSSPGSGAAGARAICASPSSRSGSGSAGPLCCGVAAGANS